MASQNRMRYLLFNRIRDASARAKEKHSPEIATLRHGMR